MKVLITSQEDVNIGTDTYQSNAVYDLSPDLAWRLMSRGLCLPYKSDIDNLINVAKRKPSYQTKDISHDSV